MAYAQHGRIVFLDLPSCDLAVVSSLTACNPMSLTPGFAELAEAQLTTIFPQIFTDQPLILKTTYEGAENDHAIHCAGHQVGRIMLTPMSGGAESWLWTVTGP